MFDDRCVIQFRGYRKNVPTQDGEEPTRGVSSAGRAPALQAGGHRFDPGTLHHKKLTEVPLKDETSLNFLGNSNVP